RQIKDLESEVEEVTAENLQLKDTLKQQTKRTDDLEQRQRHINVIIDGIPVTKNEKIYDVVTALGTRLGIDDPLHDVQIAHRVGSTNKKKPKPIVVRLLDSKTRDKWTQAYRKVKLWEEKIYVNEHLTQKNQKILYQAKLLAKEKKFKFVWVKDCKVHVRQNEESRVYVIRNMEDLEMIFKKKIPMNETFRSNNEIDSE
ncbi:hypothetical protein WDU94_002716, partial [Cyamophila willieti]